VKGIMLEAGAAVFVLLALIIAFVAVGVAMTLIGHGATPIVADVREFARAVLYGLLSILGVAGAAARRDRRDGEDEGRRDDGA
jgi:hypothetical protein